LPIGKLGVNVMIRQSSTAKPFALTNRLYTSQQFTSAVFSRHSQGHLLGELLARIGRGFLSHEEYFGFVGDLANLSSRFDPIQAHFIGQV